MTRLPSVRFLALPIAATLAILAASLVASPAHSQKLPFSPGPLLRQEPACHLKGEHTLNPYCIQIACPSTCELITILTEHGVLVACLCNLDNLEEALQHALFYPADGSGARFLCPAGCPYRERSF